MSSFIEENIGICLVQQFLIEVISIMIFAICLMSWFSSKVTVFGKLTRLLSLYVFATVSLDMAERLGILRTFKYASAIMLRNALLRYTN